VRCHLNSGLPLFCTVKLLRSSNPIPGKITAPPGSATSRPMNFVAFFFFLHATIPGGDAVPLSCSRFSVRPTISLGGAKSIEFPLSVVPQRSIFVCFLYYRVLCVKVAIPPAHSTPFFLSVGGHYCLLPLSTRLFRKIITSLPWPYLPGVWKRYDAQPPPARVPPYRVSPPFLLYAIPLDT